MYIRIDSCAYSIVFSALWKLVDCVDKSRIFVERC